MSKTTADTDLTPGEWKFEPETEDDDLELELGERQAGHIYVETGPDSVSVLVEADWATDSDLAVMAASKNLLSLVRRFVALPSGAWHPQRHAAAEMELMAEARTAITAATTYPRGETS